MTELSHLTADGSVKMVDVTDKFTSVRIASASATITMAPDTIGLITHEKIPKGNVLTTAKIAGIQAAKSTSRLIPLCHPVRITCADITFQTQSSQILITATVTARDTTGIEMEALTAASVTALTIYDMCKAVDKTMTISDIRVIEKKGGKSSHSQSDYRPETGILVLSDRISKGIGEDTSGEILKRGFTHSGCRVSHFQIIPDDPDQLLKTIENWRQTGVELIVTSGGTGLSSRDITIQTLEPLFDKRLTGIENALHRVGSESTHHAMLSRLAAGVIGNAIMVCLPGSSGAAEDGLRVLIPAVFHAFDMIHGNSSPG